MKCYTLVTLAVGAVASVNIADDIAHGLRMGLLPRQVATNNLQAFTSGLGGLSADAITQSNDATRQFEVAGDTFVGEPLFPNTPASRPDVVGGWVWGRV